MKQYFRRPQDVVGEDRDLLTYWNTMSGKGPAPAAGERTVGVHPGGAEDAPGADRARGLRKGRGLQSAARFGIMEQENCGPGPGPGWSGRHASGH